MKDVPGDQMWWNTESPGRGDEELRGSLHAMNLQEPEAEDKRRGWQRKKHMAHLLNNCSSARPPTLTLPPPEESFVSS